MRFIIIVAVTVALLGDSYADEDKDKKFEEKKKHILEFYNCVFCSNNPDLMAEYMKCSELKPEKAKKCVEECKKEVMPGMEDPSDRLNAYCDPETKVAEKMFDCIRTHGSRKDLEQEDLDKFKEFKLCAMKLDKKFCHRDEKI